MIRERILQFLFAFYVYFVHLFGSLDIYSLLFLNVSISST